VNAHGFTTLDDDTGTLDDDTLERRFDLFGALWLFCSRYHGGQSSRGYRILSRLSTAGYSPGLGLQRGEFESEDQAWIYNHLVNRYAHTV